MVRVSQMVSIPSNKSEQLKNMGEIIDSFLLCPPPPLTAHPRSRLINSYNSSFLPTECTARPDQKKEMKNLHLKYSLIQPTPTKIAPAKYHGSCVPHAEHTADGKTETGGAKIENHSLCLACSCTVSRIKKTILDASLPAIFTRDLLTIALKQVVTIIDAFSAICLPTACCSLKSQCLMPAKESCPLDSGYLTSPVPKPPSQPDKECFHYVLLSAPG